MEVALADRHPDGWQFQHVTGIGFDARIQRLVATAPLKAETEALPSGSNAGTDFYPWVVNNPYILLSFSLPANIPGVFTFSGRILILKKSREFCRDSSDTSAIVVWDYTYGADVFPVGHQYAGDLLLAHRDEYSDAFVVMDWCEPHSIWYYTIFYENALTGRFAYSPLYSHARTWALENPDVSKHSAVMFDQLIPRSMQVSDYEEGNGILQRLLEGMGRVVDQSFETLEMHRVTQFDVDEMDAGRLPYVDWLLAWSTNFELNEVKRRKETKQITTLWKAKGRKVAMAQAIQTVTGWHVTIREGWKWVATTNPDARLDPSVPPAGWNPATDGIWADLVNDTPYPTTVDCSNPLSFIGDGTERDIKTYTPSFDARGMAGYGNWWQNQNGLLIELTEVPGISGPISQVMINKIMRVAPLFAAHYATLALTVVDSDDEIWDYVVDEDYTDDALSQHSESWPYVVVEDTTDTTPDKCVLYSYPHPVYPLLSVSNSPYFVTWHSWLVYACTLPPDEDGLMPQFNTMTSDQTLPHGGGTLSLGQMSFDPTAYSGIREFFFHASMTLGGPTVGKTGRARLYNLTDAEYVAGAEVTLTGAMVDPTDVFSAALTVGAAAGNLKNSLKTYEVRLDLVASANPLDVVVLGVAGIMVT